MEQMIQNILAEYEANTAKLAEVSIAGTPEAVTLAKRQAQLESTVDLIKRLAEVRDQLAQTKSLLNDAELGDLARD